VILCFKLIGVKPHRKEREEIRKVRLNHNATFALKPADEKNKLTDSDSPHYNVRLN